MVEIWGTKDSAWHWNIPQNKKVKVTVPWAFTLGKTFKKATVAKSHPKILFCSLNWIALLSLCYCASCCSPYGGTSDPSVATSKEYEVWLLPGKVDLSSTALQPLHTQNNDLWSQSSSSNRIVWSPIQSNSRPGAEIANKVFTLIQKHT